MRTRDTLYGGKGNDVLKGGADDDTFVFKSAKDSGRGAKADVIKDFDDSGNDRIDLSAFKGKFSYIRDADFTGKMQVRIEDVKGADVVVQVNTGGSLKPEFEIRLSKTGLAAMGADDFIL